VDGLSSIPSTHGTVCVFFAFGCDRARYDTHMLLEYFKRNRWRITSRLPDADVIVMCLCGFTQGNEDRSLKVLARTLKKKRQDATLLVMGCLAGICKTRIIGGFDAIPISLHNSTQLDEFIGAEVPLLEVFHNRSMFAAPNNAEIRYIDAIDNLCTKFSFSTEPFVAAMTRLICRPTSIFPPPQQRLCNVRVATGCLEDCTYCAIKNASGRLRSRPLETIVKEFRAGLANGYTTIKLLGEDIGAYGQDLGSNIVELLKTLLRIEGDYQIVWTDFHPRWLIQHLDKLLEVIVPNTPRFGYIGFPIQSGNDGILRRMRRDHHARDAEHALLELKRAVPSVHMLTHVLIGFPGESVSAFEDTMQFVRTVGFEHVYVYRYSDRPNTDSVQMPEKVSEFEKLKRYWKFVRRFRDRSVL